MLMLRLVSAMLRMVVFPRKLRYLTWEGRPNALSYVLNSVPMLVTSVPLLLFLRIYLICFETSQELERFGTCYFLSISLPLVFLESGAISFSLEENRPLKREKPLASDLACGSAAGFG